MKASLANRLRIGLAVLLVILGGVTVLGVGRLFQLRRDFEDSTSRAFQLQVAAERMRSAFVLEQASLVHFDREPRPARITYNSAADASREATAAAEQLAAHDPRAAALLARRVQAEVAWRRRVARRVLAHHAPPPSFQRQLATPVFDAGSALGLYTLQERQALRRQVSSDSRKTLTLVLIGLGSAVVAAALFFFGLINSMREPLARLVTAARRLAARDLGSRVEVSGPIETATLGEAFNEMASELQGAYRRIEEVRNQLSVTVESLADGLVTVDDGGRILQLNPAARALLPEAESGTAIGEAIGDPQATERLMEVIANRERGEMPATKGERVLSVLVAPLGGERGAVLSIRDVSERARVEKLKDEFVATASHELRSPLTSVKGFAELLMLQRDQMTDEQVENVEIILEGTSHLVQVLNNLLDLARSDAGRLRIAPEQCDVAAMVDEVVKLMRPRIAAKGHRLQVAVDPDLPHVLVEPARFRQVLGNLLTNANDYTPDGGEIEVTAMAVGPEIEVAVRDSGPGIPADKLEEVFGRFNRLDAGETQSITGSGLGLAISKSLVELHGGAIGVDSKLGEGSTFRFVLPAVQAGGPNGAGADGVAATESVGDPQ
ncbi:MAG: two-component system, OmpR family, sensor histidine kinase ResE [Solirubrobacterales bacterium]|jgi:signal transduction histidine kinase|nr:two-component system, OmpR family, sensor histidine kinase ResE [Solirubrobacterales bacterium]MDX6663508.1 two-component system, OmpR family, sensor histidine kinase ResE [Solirubrobacterales bacterium]